MRFERSLSFDGLQEGEVSLWVVLRGVDYYAQVWVNDKPVGQHQGYFQTFDITGVVRTGDNRISVDASDPLEEPGTVWSNHKRMSL